MARYSKHKRRKIYFYFLIQYFLYLIPGWESLNSVKPNISNDNQCIILRNRFPHKEKCELLPSFFWTLDDCDLNGAVVCKKKPRELDCVVGKGVYYQGIINVSETGKPCMRWDNAGVNDYMSKRKSTFVIDETHNIGKLFQLFQSYLWLSK